MSKRSVFTTITPLPAGVTRKIVLDFLRDHEEMIDLNPLVKERHPIATPPHAPADELDCRWYSLTDKISYLPGVAGDITYTCAFHDLTNGVQTHCYAPAGLTIREKWTVGGSLPGEPAQPVELGLKAPPTGLYLREDVDMRCNVIMAGFVKKTLKKSHAALVDRLKIKAEIASSTINSEARSNRNSSGSEVSVPSSKPAPSELAGSTASQYPNYPPTLTSSSISRPSSAASVTSTASSFSSYSVQSGPMWSPAASSLGTSPALSAKSPLPTPSNSSYQYRPSEYVAQQPKQLAQPPPLLPLTTLIPPTPTPDPDTPFLRHQQPDWPLPLATRRTQPQSDWPFPSTITTTTQSQPAWPLPLTTTTQPQPAARPRPYSQQLPSIAAYKPPVGHPALAAQRDSPAPAPVRRNSELTDDALWQALGGAGRVGGAGGWGLAATATNGASYRLNGSRGGSHARAFSEGSHPDYPQMSPYDDVETEVGVVKGWLGLRGERVGF